MRAHPLLAGLLGTFPRAFAMTRSSTLVSGTSTVPAKYAYSREIVMQARLMRDCTADIAQGSWVGFMGCISEVFHAAIATFFARLDETCRDIKHVEGCGDAI